MLPLDQILSICLFVFGAAWIIADSKISLPFRHWIVEKYGPESFLIQGLECPPCLSFWLGFFVGVIPYHSLTIGMTTGPICTAFSILAWTYVQRGGTGPGTG